MSGVELHFLGNFEVLHDGLLQDLPPSRKTRALLAYLSLQNRLFHREHLCELLWEIPDDPRGSLRWSLSKLRRLVDSNRRKRIVADRDSVRLDAGDLAIDFVELCNLAERGLADSSRANLEDAAHRFRGHFLEGLEFSEFHEFHAWFVAERERAVRARVAILRELIRRSADEPERSLPHAHALVALSPYDEDARAGLIRLLVALRHLEEAKQQFRLGRNMLKELGVESSGALQAALQRTPTTGTHRTIAEPDPHPAAAADSRTDAVLYGRDEELALLYTSLDSTAADSRARILMLSGESGIGKSSLLAAVARRALDEGAYLLESSAYQSETNRPFALWIDALRRDSPEAEEAVFGDQNLEHRDRLLGALSNTIAREAGKRPVVIIFDDFHWCDESSAAALHYVVRMNRSHPVLGLIATRAGDLRDNARAQQVLHELHQDRLLGEVPLGPLPKADIQQLIEEMAPSADSEKLSRECGGNPLFAIELARSGGDHGSLDDLVRERVARFDEEGAEVLRWAAVLSPHVEFDMLVRLSGLGAEAVGAALERAELQGILGAPHEGLGFSHDLLARGVYTGISPVRRQVMHRRVALMMEEVSRVDLDHAAQLAHHASQSGDAGLAARALVLAGRLCLRFFANERAAQHARRGLQLAAQLAGSERVRVSIELHDILASSSPVEDWESAASEYVALAEQALDLGDLEHARLGYQMASVQRWEHGHWSGAREVSLQAARIARGGDDEQNILGLAETAKCLVMLERDLPQAEAMLMEAQALADRIRFRHHSILIARGLLRVHEDSLDEAAELLSKAAGDHISEFQANENLVLIAWYQGDSDRALKLCEPLRELAGKLREGSEEPLARALYGLCLYHERDDSNPLNRAIEDLRIADAKHRLAYTQSRAAMIDLERGRVEAAMTRAREALECAELLQRPTEMLIAHVALHHAGSATSDDRAVAEEREAISKLSEQNVAVWARRQAQAAMSQGAAVDA
jgi:DNA-binding SARP family transcriptional activator/predicted ATPase